MRKPDEIELYAAVHINRDDADQDTVGIDEICRQIGVSPKRGKRLVEKWVERQWMDYGCNLAYAWFTPDAPAALLPWGVVQ